MHVDRIYCVGGMLHTWMTRRPFKPSASVDRNPGAVLQKLLRHGSISSHSKPSVSHLWGECCTDGRFQTSSITPPNERGQRQATLIKHTAITTVGVQECSSWGKRRWERCTISCRDRPLMLGQRAQKRHTFPGWGLLISNNLMIEKPSY
jgi:hypothetical protein